ncbi:hypothetical protein IscW_ISCW001664 [Ixodes scapularis]|uniref:Uncharacterized protein n=1 Tax=Ixodes scapularis TaxID=6945 RepID=B7P4R5_IXOSC|nr:hypothetical protein IscW_ISCW001664 [Ixodes scapularis]|eukprot:XP_002406360.1 hypothetical protein IscW_ISCW001664 [Ixodes scapularis]
MHEQAREIQALKEELNIDERYSRLPNLEIHGLTQRPREHLGEIIADIARKAGVSDFQPSDLVAAHLLPSGKSENPPVLIRFQSVGGKKKCMVVGFTH